MAIFDVREEDNEEITEILFAEECSSDAQRQAYFLAKGDINGFTINDNCDGLYIYSKQQTLDLIKALHKAIELGWIK